MASPERVAPGAVEPGEASAAVDASVVIPARNEEGYLERALESLFGQTWPVERLEAIVVANGCSDGTVETALSFARRFGVLRLTVVELVEASIPRAKNRGAWAAAGRVLIFLDADSRIAPNGVERMLAHEREGTPAGSIKMVADTRDPIDRGFFWLIEHGKRLFGIKANMLYCSRDVFCHYGGFDESMNVAEDRDFLVRLQRSGLKVMHVTDTWIATSPRRLHTLPLRLGLVTTLSRWALAHAGIGRRWPY